MFLDDPHEGKGVLGKAGTTIPGTGVEKFPPNPPIHADCLGHLLGEAQRILRAQPEFAAIVMHPGGAVHRLHGRVGEEGDAVLRFEDLCCGLESGSGITRKEIFDLTANITLKGGG